MDLLDSAERRGDEMGYYRLRASSLGDYERLFRIKSGVGTWHTYTYTYIYMALFS
jgi:hypothetical protein